MTGCKKEIGQLPESQSDAAVMDRTEVTPTVTNGMLHFNSFADLAAFTQSLQNKEADTAQVRSAYTTLGINVNAEYLPNLTDYPIFLLKEQAIGGYTSARKAEESVINAALDNCGVHINSGVQNRWFYLLSQGGTQNGVSVQGIGIDKAARIAYTNLTTFIGSSANHPAARLGAISAAIQLYGVCSNEVIQTTNAWAEVGVGAPYSGTCLTINGERIICTDFTTFPYHYGATDLPGATFSWTYPTSWTGVTSGPGNKNLQITSLGNYNPPGGYPATAVIGVTSSLGGSKQISVKIYNGGVICEGLCGHNGGERDLQKQDSNKGPEKVTMSPNPASDKITILHPEKIAGLIKVYSYFGSNLLEIMPTGSSTVIDISKLASGTYFVAVNLGGEIITKRFIKAN